MSHVGCQLAVLFYFYISFKKSILLNSLTEIQVNV